MDCLRTCLNSLADVRSLSRMTDRCARGGGFASLNLSAQAAVPCSEGPLRQLENQSVAAEPA